ncbi:asparaginase [Sneathiella sp.]|uniref:asparaginase n=1 Tax=Sneathiella sp. TaxID=1964365 RepID=UPI0039E3C6E1
MKKHSATVSTQSPIVVNVYRGPMVECQHMVNAVVSDASGNILKKWGNTEKPVYLRSAIKLLQSVPLIESGAADAFDLTDKELSLSCASHTGEPIHVAAVTAWLQKMGLTLDALECGAHWPTFPEAAYALAAEGKKPTAAHNNCSGKHAGFLTTALHLGEDLKGYIHLDHPVQKRLVKVLEDFTDLDLAEAPVGIDGCSIPTIGIPLSGAALAIARFANPERLPDERAAACRRLQNAIATEPEMIAGSDRLCTALNRSAKGAVVAKTGAEGVYLAALPNLGLGVAVKNIDGTTRGAEVALGQILQDLGVMTEEMHREIDAFVKPVQKNWNNITVGHMNVQADEQKGSN